MKISEIKIVNRTRKHLGDIKQLANSIETVGLLHPIVVDRSNKLIAGYRRIKAYEMLGRSEIPHTVIDSLDGVLNELRAERDENTCRLDFVPSEAVEIGKLIEEVEKPKAEERSGRRNDLVKASDQPMEKFSAGSVKNDTNGRTLDKVGEAIGMSRPTYTKAKKVIEFAAENPEYKYIVEEMDDTGKVDRAAKELKRVQKLIERQNNQIELPDNDNVWLGDFREVGLKIPDNSVDLIFTDPPYNENAIELYRDLGKFANRVLKPGGLCLAYSGQIFLPQVLNALNENLEYIWCFAIKHNGAYTRIWKPKVNNAWKPILMYCKPPYEVWWTQIVDLIEDKAADKDEHEWQQSNNAPDYYLEKLCPSGGIVVDPFVGSGTTLLSAKKLGLRYIGIEDDIEDVQKTIKRLDATEVKV